MLSGRRAYALAALALAVLLAVLTVTSVAALALVMAGAIALGGCRAHGVVRPAPGRTRTPDGVIEAHRRRRWLSPARS